MKNVNITIFLLLSFYSGAYSQNFFPTNVGNQYQMDNHWNYWGPGGYYDSGLDYFKYSILSDTVIDGLQYFKPKKTGYSNPFDFDCYLRFDSSKQILFMILPNDTSKHIAVDFTVPTDSFYITYITGEANSCKSNGTFYDTLFGNIVRAYSLTVEDGGFDYRKFYFADRFGLYSYHFFEGDVHLGSDMDQNLIAAKIDSIIYNPIILSIDSIYPIIDRPLNTFPYLMWINHSESYQGLVDSFYTIMQHLRGDSILATTLKNISINDSKTTVYFDSLKAGDVVQFKVVLSDSSIFLNQDTYPDTGWIKVNVLPAITDIDDENDELNFFLNQNYPNPFNPSTSIQYAISSRQFVTLKVFDVLGKEVATLVNEEKPAGNYEVEFKSSVSSLQLASGIYYYQLIAGDFSQSKKMILMK